MAAKKFPQAPAHPERVCWGCDLYCPANDMRCGNGSDRTPHPAELFGEDWDQWGLETDREPAAPATDEKMSRYWRADAIGDIVAIEMGADAVDIGKTIHPHPTLGESIGMAAEVATAVARTCRHRRSDAEKLLKMLQVK